MNMIEQEILKKLKEAYPDNIVQLELLVTYMNQLEEASLERKKDLLENIQQIINELYSLKPCDYLIEIQVDVNEYRNEFDIYDPREVVNVVDGEEFVQ